MTEKKKDGRINVNVLRIRQRLNLTQEQVSEKMKCSRTAFCRLEYGLTSIFSRTAEKFIRATGCNGIELITGVALPVNPDGTLMQEKDYDELRSSLVNDYENRLDTERKEKEKMQELCAEKDRTIRAQEKTIKSLEQTVRRLEKELDRYNPD